jgi:hypothetical protein
MSLGASSEAATRRSRMPVFLAIHSCEVSTFAANSSLVTAFAGT